MGKQPQRALIVDDDERVRRSVAKLLRGRLETLDCGDTQHALALLDQAPVDVVVTDFDLGEEHDGVWLAREIRKRHPQVRIVLISGTMPLDAHHLVDEGVLEGFLAKPFDMRQLYRSLGLDEE